MAGRPPCGDTKGETSPVVIGERSEPREQHFRILEADEARHNRFARDIAHVGVVRYREASLRTSHCDTPLLKQDIRILNDSLRIHRNGAPTPQQQWPFRKIAVYRKIDCDLL